MPVSVPASVYRPGVRICQDRQRTRFQLNVCCKISRIIRTCCNAPRPSLTGGPLQSYRQDGRRNCNRFGQTRVLCAICQCRTRGRLDRPVSPCNGLRLHQLFSLPFSVSGSCYGSCMWPCIGPCSLGPSRS